MSKSQYEADPSWWNDEDILMAIDLGYDESGSGDTLLVSVQIGIYEQAKRLKRKWKARLREAGVEYFHSKEFDNFDHGVFAGLSWEERDELLADLSSLIHRHLIAGVTGKVTKSFYDQKTTNEFRSQWGTAYSFAIQMLIHCAYINVYRRNQRFDFNIVIERGHRHSVQALAILNKAMGNQLVFPSSKMLNVGLGSKADHPILQAADMLAYSICQKWNDPDRDFPIYTALHVEGSSYVPQFIDLDTDLVDLVKDGVDEWMEKKKAFGARKPLIPNSTSV